MLCNFIKQENGKYKCSTCGFMVCEPGPKDCKISKGFATLATSVEKKPCGGCGNSEARKLGLQK